MSLRDFKRQARRELHRHLCDPVLYLARRTDSPLQVTARLHITQNPMGEMRRAGFAEMQEYNPEIVFLVEEVASPKRDAIVVTQDMGAWLITAAKPPHDITITAEVIKLSDKQVTDYGWNPARPWLGLLDPAPPAPPEEP